MNTFLSALEPLESRLIPAGITFDRASRALTILGTVHGDAATVSTLGGMAYTSMTTEDAGGRVLRVERVSVPAELLRLVVFRGGEGNDVLRGSGGDLLQLLEAQSHDVHFEFVQFAELFP